MPLPFHEYLGKASAKFPSLYLFNNTLEQLENAPIILLLGCNLRKENPLLYLRIRRNYLRRRSTAHPLKVLSIGSPSEYDTVPITQLGVTVQSILLLVEGRLNGCKELFFSGFSHLHQGFSSEPFFNPKMILGPGLFLLPCAAELQHLL